MKLHFQKTNTADKLSISKSILTQNGVETDLDNVTVFEQNEEGTLTQPDIYKDADDILHIIIRIDTDRQFMVINDNLMKFYDIDKNGDISIDEFARFIEYYNKSEDDRRAYHLSRL